jgi:hypothetical protein
LRKLVTERKQKWKRGQSRCCASCPLGDAKIKIINKVSNRKPSLYQMILKDQWRSASYAKLMTP